MDCAPPGPSEFARDLQALLHPKLHPGPRNFISRWIARRYFARPIAPQRWSVVGAVVRTELAARASRNRTTPAEELELEVRAAVVIAAGGIDLNHPAPDVFERVRAAVGNELCRSLVGPGWRCETTTAGSGAGDGWAPAHVVPGESALELERLAARYPAEIGLLAEAATALSRDELARSMGITRSALDKRVWDARRKISMGR
ncbi:MAG: hypothetical protein AB7I01_01895 [Gammaproteobacteria bacterium]